MGESEEKHMIKENKKDGVIINQAKLMDLAEKVIKLAGASGIVYSIMYFFLDGIFKMYCSWYYEMPNKYFSLDISIILLLYLAVIVTLFIMLFLVPKVFLRFGQYIRSKIKKDRLKRTIKKLDDAIYPAWVLFSFCFALPIAIMGSHYETLFLGSLFFSCGIFFVDGVVNWEENFFNFNKSLHPLIWGEVVFGVCFVVLLSYLVAKTELIPTKNYYQYEKIAESEKVVISEYKGNYLVCDYKIVDNILVIDTSTYMLLPQDGVLVAKLYGYTTVKIQNNSK